MKGLCECCHTYNGVIHRHHLIPRWLEEDGEIIRVCVPCHRRLDGYFDRFIKWGTFHPPKTRFNSRRDRELEKQYYELNKKERIAYQKKWNKDNRERIRELNCKRRRENLQQIKDYSRARYHFQMGGETKLKREYEEKYGVKVNWVSFWDPQTKLVEWGKRGKI